MTDFGVYLYIGWRRAMLPCHQRCRKRTRVAFSTTPWALRDHPSLVSANPAQAEQESRRGETCRSAVRQGLERVQPCPGDIPCVIVRSSKDVAASALVQKPICPRSVNVPSSTDR